jgi:hypothetical protein
MSACLARIVRTSRAGLESLISPVFSIGQCGFLTISRFLDSLHGSFSP